MLKCIAKILKRGKRRKVTNAKNSPWSIHCPGLFRSHKSFMGDYDAEIFITSVKNNMTGKGHHKFPK